MRFNREGGEDAGLELIGDTDDARVEVGEPEPLQRLLVDGVGLHDVGEPRRHALDHAQVGVDAEHFVTGPSQLLRDRGAEAPEANHGNLLLHGVHRPPLIRY